MIDTCLKDEEAGQSKMIINIGITAGEIWCYLEKHSQVTLADLAQHTHGSRDDILMSMGWLAREGHVVLEEREFGYRCSLRKQNGNI